MEPVAITGIGAVSAVGAGADALFDALRTGRSGIRPIRRFDASFVPGAVAGEVDDAGEEPCVALAARAAREAWERAGRPEPARIAVVAGSSSGPHAAEDLLDRLEREDPPAAARLKRRTRHLAVGVAAGEAVGAGGPRLAVSTACASGLAAIALATDLVRQGLLDVALAGGGEGLSARRLAGFHALGALAPGPCAPFSDPPGMSLGEGAAFLVLERASSARARGAEVLGYVLGSGGSADAHHATAPDPRGDGLARAIRLALAQAGVERVDLASAHGTGTEANDAAEWLALTRVFGDPPPIYALKSLLGHSFGAAGALEAVAAVWALRTRAVPASAGFRGPRALGPPRFAPGPAPISRVLLENAAFGGANVAVVLGDAPGPAIATREVGVAAVSRGGPFPPSRDLDDPARVLAGAAHDALGRAGVARDRARRDRVGLWVATSRRPVAASAAYRESVSSRGLGGASGAAFARTVLNATAGAVGRALSLRGPTAAVSSGPGSALIALIGASAVVARAGAERIVVGAVDELDPALAGLDPESDRPAEDRRWAAGVAAVVLAPDAPVRIRGALAGPGRLADAIEALPRPARAWSTAAGPLAAAREAAAIGAVWPGIPVESVPAAYGESVTALERVVAAVEAADQGAGLVVSDDPEVGAVAVWVSA
jgi:3-oxoacyl-[acyl-carrier-protein] synthase II